MKTEENIKSIKSEILDRLLKSFGKTVENATSQQLYNATAISIRDRIMENLKYTREITQGKKTLYYFSLEFLTGKFLESNLLSLELLDVYDKALKELGFDMNELKDLEPEPGLGNGGLGRLAACSLDSLATTKLPAMGCGIRYDLGLFKQRIVDGQQVELPDPWLEDGFAWEVSAPEDQVEVHFGGRVIEYFDSAGSMRHRLEGTSKVIAVPYDVPICGYKNRFTNVLRLWSARAPQSVDLSYFAQGDYVKAASERELAETISRMLYPNDSHNSGKSLRLRQQYFFTSATLSYILTQHLSLGLPLEKLPEYVSIQINDTHPAIAIPELMRLLVDVHFLKWEEAFDICQKVFSYTNHTIMSEALEAWPLYLIENLLPRISMIIRELDRRWKNYIKERTFNSQEVVDDLKIVSFDRVRMANLCLSCCGTINGVSELHTAILKEKLFYNYNKMFPENIIAITNGVTPRRWILQCNPELSKLISDSLNSNEWITNLELLHQLESFILDSSFKNRLDVIKRNNKMRFSKFIMDQTGHNIDPDSILDVQIKRLHEYKRQLLNLLHILYMYYEITVEGKSFDRPRTFVFGAKAFPGYERAKQIIAFACSLSELIDAHSEASKFIKLIFVENYNAASAQIIIPASDISQQISLAGREASGTGNMKFMMNGALTIGTRDGANLEMHSLLGDENIFFFGLTSKEVENELENKMRSPERISAENPLLSRVIYSLGDGTFPLFAKQIMNSLLYGEGGIPDPFLCLSDFASYSSVRTFLYDLYEDRDKWLSKCIINIARSSFFSSDRCIDQYNNQIWKL